MSRLKQWLEPEAGASSFRSRGFGSAAVGKGELMARASRCLVGAGVDETSPVHPFFVPGRIEVLGKHTDYAGGRSLVAAAEQGFCLVARPRTDRQVRMWDAASGVAVSFELGQDLVPTRGHWSNYPMTVARRIAQNFPDAALGVDLAFCSDLPPAAGMSSSSAFTIGTFLALREANELEGHPSYQRNIDDDLSLAEYLGTNENGQSYKELAGGSGVGTFGGSEDHTAILCSTAGTLGQFAYCPTRFERRVGIPDGYIFVIGCSGVTAEKTGAGQELYNRVSGRAAALVKAWNGATGETAPHLEAILATDPGAVDQLRVIVRRGDDTEYGTGELVRRLDQFAIENMEIVGPAGAALERNDLAEFAGLVSRSQKAGAELLENQVEETVFLADGARDCGAAAASAFGAGFGGTVWALVATEEVAAFIERWERDYRAWFPHHREASFFSSHAGPPAFELD